MTRYAYPIDSDDVRDRYMSDAYFKAIADHVHAILARSEMDIASVSQACVLGCQMYLERNCQPIIIRIEGGEKLR